MTGEELKTLARRSHTLSGLSREVDRQLRQLEEKRAAAEKQAEEWKKRSLKNLVGTFLGRTGKRLREKELELYMLDKKREELTRRKAAVEEELTACETLLSQPGDEETARIVRLCRLENRGRDIAEAIRQGDGARELCKGLRLTLEQAREFGWLDAVGSSHGANEAKHAKLEDVQSMVNYLRRQMEAFDFALEPLGESLEADPIPEVKHWLYDGLILEWIVLKRIDDALARVTTLGRYLSETVWRLEKLQKENQLRRGELP